MAPGKWVSMIPLGNVGERTFHELFGIQPSSGIPNNEWRRGATTTRSAASAAGSLSASTFCGGLPGALLGPINPPWG